MPYVEHGMWEVLDVLERIHRGESQRHIERATGRSRRTINRYIQRAEKLGWCRTEPPSEQLAGQIVARARPGPQSVEASSARVLESHVEQIKQWLAPHDGYRRGLKLSRAHALLEAKGVQVSYWTFRRFVHSRLDYGKSASTVRVADVRPGELAEVDFGRLGTIYDPDGGRHRPLHALIVTLVFSRHQYVHVSHSQKLDDLIDGLEDAWDFFGGVPSRVVIDNLKPAVHRADRYNPSFQRTFNEYAKHRNFIIDAAVVRHPQGKPHVERQVQYVRENFFRGEQWLSREHVQREARRWCLQTAGIRIHGTTRQQPLQQFESMEKPALLPLDGERFDTPLWGELKVHPDHHIQFDYALYSVPYTHNGTHTKGKQVTVRGDKRLVRIYFQGELIKTHERKPKGARSTDYTDYPVNKTSYAMRDANYVIGKAKQQGESVGRMAEMLLAGEFPWAKLRQAQRLLRLSGKYGPQRVDAACKRALAFELIDVRRVERIILQAMNPALDEATKTEPRSDNVVDLSLRFLRPAKSLVHQPKQKEKEDGSSTLT